MTEIRDKAIGKMADLYFARWSSGCVKERYEAVRNDGIEFAKQVLKEVPELAIVDRKAKLPIPYIPAISPEVGDERFAKGAKEQRDIIREAGWVKEVKD